MSIQNDKLMNLQDGQVLYNDLRDRIEDTKLNATLSTPTPIISFSDGSPYPMQLTAAIDPVQDLHGYDHPWPAGGGKNLQIGSPSFDGYVNPNNSWTKQTETYNGHDVWKKTGAWGGMYKSFSVEAGTYTFSAVVKTNDSRSVYVYLVDNNDTGKAVTDILSQTKTTGTSFGKISVTFTVSTAGNLACRIEREASGDLYISEYQLEVGSSASTFSPYSNICPISGFDGANVTVTGKNLAAGVDWVLGYYVSDTGQIKNASGTRYSGLIRVNQDTRYAYSGVSGYASGTGRRIHAYDENGNWLAQIGFVNPTSISIGTAYSVSFSSGNATYIRISGRSEDTNIQIEEGTTATAYDPTGHIYHVAFPSAAGTVYGATVTVNPDGTGELVVDRVRKTFDGTEAWQVISSDITAWFIVGSGSNMFSDNTTHMLISNYFKTTQNNPWNVDASIWERYKNQIHVKPGTNISPSGQTQEGLAEFKAWLATNNLQVICPLATPITYSLTPGQVLALLGMNNVWADTGNILSLSYVRNTVPEMLRQDTAGQINTVVNPVKTELDSAEAAMAIVVDGDTAPKNITSGQYVFVKKHSTLATGMYHATAAIAAGASITSSNVSADDEGGFNSLFGSIDTLNNSLANQVPEFVSNANGNAYKFPSGMMVCTKNIRINAACTNLWGSLYESQQIDLGSWAVQFQNERPTVSITNTGGQGGWFEYVTETSGVLVGKTYLLRPNQNTSDVYIDIIGVGRWK